MQLRLLPYAITILFLFIAGMVKADTSSLTLTDAIHQALHDSPELQKTKANAEIASWRRVESYSGFLPSIQLSSSILADKKYVYFDTNIGPFPAIAPNSDVILSAQLPLFDGFSNFNRLSAARSFEHAAESELTWDQFKTEREVILQFYHVIAQQTLKEVAEQNIKTLDDHLKEARLFKSAGVSTNYDVLRVDVEMSEARSEALNAADNVQSARDLLNTLLGTETDDRPLQGSLPILQAELLAALNTSDSLSTIHDRGDIQALQYRSDAYDSQESSAGKYWVPKVSLFGQYNYYNNRTNGVLDSNAYRNAYQVGLGLTWNIFDGLTSFAKSKQSVQERFKNEKELQLGKIKAKQEYDFWRRKFIYYCSIYQARQDDIQKSNETVRLAREGRKAGVRTNSDLLDAELELFRARAGSVNAQMGAIESLIQVELATGKKLYTFN